MIKINSSELKAARTSSVWCTLSTEAQGAGLGTAIKNAYVLKGVSYTQEQLATTCSLLSQFIDRRYPAITVGEIKLALESGARGDLGNRDTYMSPAAMQSWLATFYESPERAGIIDRMDTPKVRVLAAPDEEGLNWEFYRTKPHQMLEALRSGDETMGTTLDVISALIYDFLSERGLLSGMSPATRAEAEREAAEWFTATRHTAITKVVSLGRDSVEDHIKRILLKRYFRALINNNRQLKYQL